MYPWKSNQLVMPLLSFSSSMSTMSTSTSFTATMAKGDRQYNTLPSHSYVCPNGRRPLAGVFILRHETIQTVENLVDNSFDSGFSVEKCRFRAIRRLPPVKALITGKPAFNAGEGTFGGAAASMRYKLHSEASYPCNRRTARSWEGCTLPPSHTAGDASLFDVYAV